jgi:hypothetical protein
VALMQKHLELFAYFQREWCGFPIKLVGEIDSGTVIKVQRLLEERSGWVGSRKPEEAGELIVDSTGGNVAAAIAIGRMLRVARMPISIPKGQQCISACVLVLAGAVTRNYGGRVGIHRPYFDLSNKLRPLQPNEVRLGYADLLQTIRTYLREMNVSERLADDMLAIDPVNVRYLQYDELEQYGLKWHDPVEQETLDLQEAQSLGLDRREYIRRQAIEQMKCEYHTLEMRLRRAPDLPDFESCWQSVMKLGR